MAFLKKSKNKEKKQREKRSWFSSRRATNIQYTESSGPESSTYLSYASVAVPGTRSGASKGNDNTRVPTAALMNSESFDQQIIQTELSVQRQIRDLESRGRDKTLQSDTGVLLFEGMTMQQLDEQSEREIDEQSIPEKCDTFETGFVDAPKYDPVKSGFYGKKKKHYYDDSDDEDDTVPGASPKDRKAHDGSIWDLMGGFLMQPSSTDVAAKK